MTLDDFIAATPEIYLGFLVIIALCLVGYCIYLLYLLLFKRNE